MNKIVTTLEAARKLIEKKENWGRGFYGTGKGGEILVVDPGTAHEMDHPENKVVPDCFCGIGAACYAASDTLNFGAAAIKLVHAALQIAPDRIYGYNTENFYDFNDDPKTTHAEVLAVYDKAIELAKESP